MTTLIRTTLLSAVLIACGDKDDSGAHHTDDTAGSSDGNPDVAPYDDQQLSVGDTVTYTVSGLTDAQAYRVTLVSDANITVADGSGTFIDEDANGAADAGASTAVATIIDVNGDAYDGSKTVPGTDDDPSAPSGIYPSSGEISVTISAVGAGTAWLVAYENGGESTFLEIDSTGAPIEPHGVGGAIVVSSDGVPDITPAFDRAISADAETSYTITDLDDGQAYRITLVVSENITRDGASGVFVDADASGTADAGSSEAVGLITSVNGEKIDGSKTWPAGDDDPSDPSGIFPVGGQIDITVAGVGAGSINPVAYENGGSSTFLEVDGSGVPTENYAVGSTLTVE